MVFLAAVVFGAFSYRRLPVSLMPDGLLQTLSKLFFDLGRSIRIEIQLPNDFDQGIDDRLLFLWRKLTLVLRRNTGRETGHYRDQYDGG